MSADVLGADDLLFASFDDDLDTLPMMGDDLDDNSQLFADNSDFSWDEVFDAPAPAMNAAPFTTPAPASSSQWNCPNCAANMSVFAVSCPCGFSVDAPSSTECKPEPKPVAAVEPQKPLKEEKKAANKKRMFRCTAGENCEASFNTKTELAEHSRDHHSLEATEARERQLRQQLRQVEQNHAVLREYSNLLRKLLASAQVKVSSSTNPFNVVGGRPKRLFRCSKNDSRQREQPEQPAQPVVRTAAGRGRGRGCRRAGRGRGSGRGSGRAGIRVPVTRPREERPAPVQQKPAIVHTLEQPEDHSAARDVDHGPLAFPAFDDCDGLGDLVSPFNDEWFCGMPPSKSARVEESKPRADSFGFNSPFLVASAEASW
mmetsp:Transcript_9208/g.13408  ORF Transcript_9208/g.13408 Transcript_9208/m.13408 type:complete len:372 (-) Transcript_9208:111-1226(-)|eukprot:CAMPEP_0195524442 /NCGR_PEP_ID=MMETSP0794_2-20130614/24269_1 /TAXON_ID=515487 /ORGANISM="Stephanopyxis turris, Strain CCMP 815" /LENGTH=371 /DNA_ID=CAMNT_0040654659 /DNA_START=70 /DNA_END=1185 /DNA_ORIENTATION=+